MSTGDLKDRIRRRAAELGFDRVGFAQAGACRDAGRLERWLDEGRHGEMEWMAREPHRRTDPRRVLEGARTVVSLITFYPPAEEESGNTSPGPGRVSRYARGRDYHNVIGRRLKKLAKAIENLAPGTRTIPCVDHRPILEKEWAQRAGLGWIGKHTNLITADAGSFFFLAELVTDLDLEADSGPHRERCGTCRDCIDACPTGAITGPFQVDARRCISYLTIELEGAIPEDLRPLVGEWIFGCDICQEACPWNRFAVPVREPAFQRDTRRWTGDAATFLALSEEDFRARFQGSPVMRAGRNGFLRNVCVALGNRRDPEDLPALERALEDGSELVREHAAWAIRRIREADAPSPAAPYPRPGPGQEDTPRSTPATRPSSPERRPDP